jgi:hypothetical protein
LKLKFATLGAICNKRARNRNFHLAAIDASTRTSHFQPPRLRSTETLRRLQIRRCNAIRQNIVAEPVLDAAKVQRQLHRVFAAANGVFAARVKVEVLRIARDFSFDEMVATRRVDVIAVVSPLRMVAVHCVGVVVAIGRRHTFPIGEVAVDGNLALCFDRHRVARTFEAAHVGNELIIKVVAVTALHRFDVARVLGVKGVNEIHFASAIHLVGFVHASGDPFVPAGDENEVRVEFQRVIPLFLKVFAGVILTLRARLFSLRIAAAVRTRIRQDAEFFIDGILRDASRDLLNFPGTVRPPINFLRMSIEPAPFAGLAAVRAIEIIGARRAKGEKVLQASVLLTPYAFDKVAETLAAPSNEGAMKENVHVLAEENEQSLIEKQAQNDSAEFKQLTFVVGGKTMTHDELVAHADQDAAAARSAATREETIAPRTPFDVDAKPNVDATKAFLLEENGEF